MSKLAKSELAEVGRNAAVQSASSGVELMDVRASNDTMGEAAYFFNFKIKRPSDAMSAVVTRLELAHAVRDELINRGDETYPYVRVSSAQGQSAAAE